MTDSTQMTLEQVRDALHNLAAHYPMEGLDPDFRDLADAIDAHLAKGAQEWQPIETAPRDGLPRLYLCNGKVIQGFVDATGSLCKQDELGWLPMRKNPTHWMPLPDAPRSASAGRWSDE